MASDEAKRHIDWELIEREYRVGIKTLRQLAAEYGVSHVTIAQRAKRYAWVRDLTKKVAAAAKDKATKKAANKQATKTLKSDAEVVEAYSEVVASVDEIQREDVGMALSTTRANLQELALMVDPAYKDKLTRIGELMAGAKRVKAESKKKEPKPSQKDLDALLDNWVDLNEIYSLFCYTTKINGRVKLAKDIAATHGVYIPIQRKIFGLDEEKQKTSEIDELLKQLNEADFQ